MAKMSFAELVNSGKVMLTGLQANAEAVARRGIDTEFMTNLQTAIVDTETLNGEQESLKAALKAKTAELDSRLMDLKKMLSEARKVVKMTIDKTRWVEFGISDKR